MIYNLGLYDILFCVEQCTQIIALYRFIQKVIERYTIGYFGML